MPATLRDQVFISYSHRDRDWLERFRTHLKPLVRKGALSVWDDSQIRVGQRWRDEIGAALARARVAVLLVSPDFLASDFIADEELPPLLDAAQREGLNIAWVPIRASLYAETEIGKYQAACDPARPLATLSEAQQDAVLVEICHRIKKTIAERTPQQVAAARLRFASGSSVALTRLFSQPRLVLGRPKLSADLWLALFPLDDAQNQKLMDGFGESHAVLQLEGEAAIRDDDSRTGTEVNGERLDRQWRTLRDGDVIGFQRGALQLKVHSQSGQWLRLGRVGNGTAQENYLILQGRAVIGSGEAAAISVIEGTGTAPQMAELRREAGGFVIAGLAVAVEINGRSVPPGTATGLSEGDRVAVGPLAFEFATGAYPG